MRHLRPEPRWLPFAGYGLLTIFWLLLLVTIASGGRPA